MLALLCPVIANGQRKQSVTPTRSGDGGMSAAFRDKAKRALDAIRRLPTTIPSAEYHEPGWEQRKLDMDKAVDEAKYKARTVKDKQVLQILSASRFLIGAAKDFPVRNPDWKLLSDAAWQCRIELMAALEPKYELSASGLKQAAKKTCLKQQDAILKKWGVPRP